MNSYTIHPKGFPVHVSKHVSGGADPTLVTTIVFPNDDAFKIVHSWGYELLRNGERYTYADMGADLDPILEGFGLPRFTDIDDAMFEHESGMTREEYDREMREAQDEVLDEEDDEERPTYYNRLELVGKVADVLSDRLIIEHHGERFNAWLSEPAQARMRERIGRWIRVIGRVEPTGLIRAVSLEVL